MAARVDGLYTEHFHNVTESYGLDSSSLFLKYRHKHVAKLDMEYKLKNWSFGTSFRYNSFMLNVDKIFVDPFFETLVPGIPESRENLADGDLIVDTRIIHEISKTTSLSLIINNLLNTEYQTRPANMMAPRTVSLKFGISL